MRSVELFVGAGGLAIGTARAGFHHEGIFEWDRNACDTITENQRRKVFPATEWPSVEPTDVRDVDFTRFEGIDLVSGGPPCQPFSIGGKHRGRTDQRNLFPEVVRAVRQSAPRAILIENVKGLTRPAFANFLEHVRLQLSYPELIQKRNEDWTDHLARLEKYHTGGSKGGLRYNVVIHHAKAANYGVPQRRDRIFIVGFRNDLSPEWSFPAETHSENALLYSQWVTREYWDYHSLSRTPSPPPRMRARIEKLKSGEIEVTEERWRTVRDALYDPETALPDPTKAIDTGFLNHIHNPGARTYKGHTGSPLDQPAKTLKAGDHGVPGGENMLAHSNGKVRYFTVRESARLQTFPDDYYFAGAWTEAMRQLGNAVPVALAELVARSIREKLEE